jgi:hypothetical protein
VQVRHDFQPDAELHIVDTFTACETQLDASGTTLDEEHCRAARQEFDENKGG